MKTLELGVVADSTTDYAVIQFIETRKSCVLWHKIFYLDADSSSAHYIALVTTNKNYSQEHDTSSFPKIIQDTKSMKI